MDTHANYNSIPAAAHAGGNHGTAHQAQEVRPVPLPTPRILAPLSDREVG